MSTQVLEKALNWKSKESRSKFHLELMEQAVEWYKDIRLFGECVNTDPAKFYTDDDDEAIDTIKNFCRECPVQPACLKYAVAMEEEGVWGGTTHGSRIYAMTLSRRATGTGGEFYWSTAMWEQVNKELARILLLPTLPHRRNGRDLESKAKRPYKSKGKENPMYRAS